MRTGRPPKITTAETPFGQILLDWIDEHKYQRRDACSMLGISANTLRRWLRGNNPHPRLCNDVLAIIERHAKLDTQ